MGVHLGAILIASIANSLQPQVLTIDAGQASMFSCARYDRSGSVIVAGCMSLGKQGLGEIRVYSAHTGKLIRSLGELKGGVSSLSLSVDGRSVAVGGIEGRLVIWRLDSKIPLIDIQAHTDRIGKIVFLPSGKELVTVGLKTNVKVWDLTTGRERTLLSNDQESPLFSCAVYDNGTKLAVGGRKVIQLWDLAKHKPLIPLRHHEDDIYSLSVSPDGSVLVACSDDHTISITSTKTNKLLGLLGGHNDRVLCGTFSRDGAIFASSGADCVINIWDTRTWKIINTLRGHKHYVVDLAFHPLANMILSTSVDGTMRAWTIK